MSILINSSGGVVTLGGGVPRRSGFVHGQPFTITGSGFGTRPNYNTDARTWQGVPHLHFAFTDFASALRGTQAATDFKAAFGGFTPHNLLLDDGDAVTNSGNKIETGGPSQSGRYYRRYYDGTNRYTAGMRADASGFTYPGTEIWICKSRFEGTITGRIAKSIRATYGTGGADGDYWLAPMSGGPEQAAGFSESNAEFENGAAVYTTLYATTAEWARLMFVRTETTQRIYVGTTLTEWYASGLQPPRSSLSWIESAWGLPVEYIFGSQMEEAATSVEGQLFADIYIDFTPARIEVVQGSVREVQILTAWAPTAISGVFNRGALALGAATLYVLDADNAQVAGMAITIT